MLTLVTGAGGFAGSHLCRELTRQGTRVVGLDRHDLDVTRSADVERIIQQNRPTEIFHLAAQSSASRSWTEPDLTYEVNVIGTHNLLEAVRRHSPTTRVLVTATSDVYGAAGSATPPIDEEERPRPVSPYAASKMGQEAVASMFHEAFALHTIVTRAFMHIGPGQPASFATADWARQIALAEKGLAEPVLRVGDIEVVREFMDVRDVVRAYVDLMRNAGPGSLYNVASGTAYPLKHVLDLLLKLAEVGMEVQADPTRMRAADPRLLVGDPRKLRDLTGWTPRYSLERSISDVLNHWRDAVSS